MAARRAGDKDRLIDRIERAEDRFLQLTAANQNNPLQSVDLTMQQLKTLLLLSFHDGRSGHELQKNRLAGGRQLHLTRPMPSLLFDTRQFVNPVLRGHIAFQVPSVEAIMVRLKRLNVPFADYGTWALPTTHQVYFHDPEGSVVEAFEVLKGGGL